MCVLDGHGPDGHEVVAHVKDIILPRFVDAYNMKFKDEGELLTHLVQQLADGVKADLPHGVHSKSGTTIFLVLVNEEKGTATMACVGDSSCSIYDRDGAVIFASDPAKQKITNPEEKRRVLNLCDPKYHFLIINHRRLYGLDMSRSIGDTDLELVGLTSSPDIYRVDLLGSSNAVILLHTDGTDNLANAEKGKIVSRVLQSLHLTDQQKAQQIAHDIVEKSTQAMPYDDDKTVVASV